jgi:hypothetical protein
MNRKNSQGEVAEDPNESMLNTSMDSSSPVLGKFLCWRKNNQTFDSIYKKIFESNLISLNPVNKEIPQDILGDMEKLS